MVGLWFVPTLIIACTSNLQVLQAVQEASRGNEKLGNMAPSPHSGESPPPLLLCHPFLPSFSLSFPGRVMTGLFIVEQIIHLKRFQFFNGRWVKSQRSVTFPTVNLEPLRYTVENGNGTKAAKTVNGAMEVQDMEDVQQSSLKRPLTPPTSGDGEPPLKRSLSDQEVEDEVKGQTTYIDEVDAGDGREDGGAGDVESEVSDAEEPSSLAAGTHISDDDLLPKDMPKAYDLFATCVS